jgi:hypothetical protein
MTATDNPEIGSSTAIATTAMIMPTDRSARADTDPPLRTPNPPRHDADYTQPYQRNRDEGVQPQIERTKIALMNVDPDSQPAGLCLSVFPNRAGWGDFGGIGSAVVSRNF